MNEEELKKELEQLPKEWFPAFASRFAAQCLPALLIERRTNCILFLESLPNRISRKIVEVFAFNVRIELFTIDLSSSFSGIEKEAIEKNIFSAELQVIPFLKGKKDVIWQH
ncbi:MAG: hypothetical protein ACTFAK_00345 [Candidatus Electronema sp. VV]